MNFFAIGALPKVEKEEEPVAETKEGEEEDKATTNFEDNENDDIENKWVFVMCFLKKLNLIIIIIIYYYYYYDNFKRNRNHAKKLIILKFLYKAEWMSASWLRSPNNVFPLLLFSK